MIYKATGLPSAMQKIQNETNVYLNLFVLLYADDTILLSESAEDLQHQLNIFHNYCSKWKMKVNVGKTKIMVFGKCNRKQRKHVFTYQNQIIDIVEHFNYLGVYFSQNGSFNYNIKQQYNKATRAMYNVIRKCKQHNLSIDLQLDLFDKIVQPILLYGCEVWGFSKTLLIEKLHLKFCKFILKINNKTPNYMVYGELGRHPLIINIKKRMISYWNNCILSNIGKFTFILYSFLNNTNSHWFRYVRSIFNECGLTFIWENQNFCNKQWLKGEVQRILFDHFLQNWNSNVMNSPKALNYRIFKEELKFESYLINLTTKQRNICCKFRTGNLKLPIEVGRWQNIDRNDRKCTLCNLNDIGDEFHYMFTCTDLIIKDARIRYIDRKFWKRPNIHQFKDLFNTKQVDVLRKISKFLEIIKERVCPPG